ncbi:DUF2366 domain containing protein [Trichuris trichiura]|uniref:DUF2366 domain containing protein n=1 Tax=Trichuris trichiura TaxID=36087 RepID=A0A077ZNP5_TRITR|nr:DUF2366 domain containing protein [Trichuris trichiura]
MSDFQNDFQGTMLQEALKLGLNRVKSYFLSLYNDYRIVAVETAVELRRKPLKGVIYATVFTGTMVAYKTRPNQDHFLSAVSDCRLKLLQIADEIRNEKSEAFINEVTNLINHNALLSLNLLFFTVIFQTEMVKGCDLFEVRKNISHLPTWLAAYGTVVDIGLTYIVSFVLLCLLDGSKPN